MKDLSTTVFTLPQAASVSFLETIIATITHGEIDTCGRVTRNVPSRQMIGEIVVPSFW